MLQLKQLNNKFKILKLKLMNYKQNYKIFKKALKYKNFNIK